VLVPPAVKVPQFMELRGVVHALLEYTPKFADADTVPLEDKVADVVMAEKVVIDKDIPIMTNATAAVIIESFSFAVIIPSSNSLLDMSPCYCVFEHHRYCSLSCAFSFFSLFLNFETLYRTNLFSGCTFLFWCLHKDD